MFVRGLFRLLYYAFVAYLILSVYRMIVGARRRPAKPAAGRAKLSGVMVKDEVCNTYLPKENALRETIGGQERFFCSRACRDKFLTEHRNGPGPR